jgi:hypothetical protein
MNKYGICGKGGEDVSLRFTFHRELGAVGSAATVGRRSTARLCPLWFWRLLRIITRRNFEFKTHHLCS